MDVKAILDFAPVKGYRIGHAPVGKPWMSVICYQVDEFMIDTGSYNARHVLMSLLDPKSVGKICLTHYHEDHAGNAGYLNRQHGIPVYGHPLTREILQRSVKLKPYEKYIWGKLEPADILPVGDRVETANYCFRVVHTPGHSVDHVVYLEENEGWLFSGDMYLGARIKYFRSDEDIVQTIASLKKLASLRFNKLFCGHNPQLEQPHHALQRKIDHLENVLGNVRHLYLQGKSCKQILRELLKGKESWLVKVITLGDVSYKHMLLSALNNVERSCQ